MDAQTGATMSVLEESHPRHVREFALDPTGDLVTRTANAVIYVQRTDPGNEVIYLLTGTTGEANSMTFNHDGTRLAAISDVDTVIFDMTTGVKLLALPHGGSQVRFSPDGKVLATLGHDGRIMLWHSLPWK